MQAQLVKAPMLLALQVIYLRWTHVFAPDISLLIELVYSCSNSNSLLTFMFKKLFTFKFCHIYMPTIREELPGHPLTWSKVDTTQG
jgi:hypothetical protein